MFSASAELYDLIYGQFKDYRAEAAALAERIGREHPGARTVLDVACGTGEHARLLSERHGFEVDGLDLDEAFVAIAQAKLPRGTVHRGDMTAFPPERRYDVVACLFSSIGYVCTLPNVTRALRCFRDALAPGGMVLVEPWFPPGAMEDGRVAVRTAEGDGVRVCRMAHVKVDGRISRLTFEYLIGGTSGIRRAAEVHELGLFTTAEMLACFREAGLSAEHDPEGLSGRGLFVARAAAT